MDTKSSNETLTKSGLFLAILGKSTQPILGKMESQKLEIWEKN